MLNRLNGCNLKGVKFRLRTRRFSKCYGNRDNESHNREPSEHKVAPLHE